MSRGRSPEEEAILNRAVDAFVDRGDIKPIRELIISWALKTQGYIVSRDKKTITCLTCRSTSHHPEDVRNRYCGHCHKFHKDTRPFEDTRP